MYEKSRCPRAGRQTPEKLECEQSCDGSNHGRINFGCHTYWDHGVFFAMINLTSRKLRRCINYSDLESTAEPESKNTPCRCQSNPRRVAVPENRFRISAQLPFPHLPISPFSPARNHPVQLTDLTTDSVLKRQEKNLYRP